MNLKDIYQPIAKDLSQVEIELKNVVRGFSLADNCQQVVEHFFNVPGKRLRPALVLLSAKAVNPELSPVSPSEAGRATLNSELVYLATAIELIHSASLIHDDIVDNAGNRREQPSMNKKFGNKIAVLAGDMLYTGAFSLLTDRFDKKTIKILSQCVEKMCSGEINGFGRDGHTRPVSSFEEYLKIIEDKTASFMSSCCQCGAMITGQNEEITFALREYGLNFGISYQLMDDYLDRDSAITFKIDMLGTAREYAIRAIKYLELLDNSKYKEGLKNLAEYVLQGKNEQTKSLSSIQI